MLRPRRNQGTKIMSLNPQKCVCVIQVYLKVVIKNHLHDTSIYSFVICAILLIHTRILSLC